MNLTEFSQGLQLLGLELNQVRHSHMTVDALNYINSNLHYAFGY